MESDPWQHNIDHILQVMANVERDKDRQCMAVITLMHGYILCPHESIRAYACHSKANWRLGGWNHKNHDEVLYNIARSGLLDSYENKVAPMRPAGARPDILDQTVDMAAVSEITHVKIKNPQQQQQQH
jgi:hypothetical protein